ncbi:MAG: NAD-specific glutamate dehydrogenase [Xanthobacteraceae bacterium]|nr:NAD-specific glutamate dehydrogenase [Xanthobacteraceae bacterium]
MAGLTESEEERAAHRLLQQAGTALAVTHPAIPDRFVADLFGRTAPEDLLVYRPAELAKLAAGAWDWLANRKAGAPKIRFEASDAAPDQPRLGAISVIEIVNDDMPFLVDSVMGELTERGLEARLVAHPVFGLSRDDAGRLTRFTGQGPAEAGQSRESFIHLHVERVDDPARRAEIVRAIDDVLAAVRVTVQDWRAMMARIRDQIASLKASPPALPADELAEATQFLEWLIADNFTFLGVRDYAVTPSDGGLEPLYDTGLGVLRSPDMRVLRRADQQMEVTPEIRAFLREPQPLIVTKAANRARVHRRNYMDYVGVKRFDADGKLLGELRIVGLFTSTAYTRSTRSIPYLRRKLDAVLRRAGFDLEGHSGKALTNVLESYPRDELFQIDEGTLYAFAMAILQLDERPRVRVLPRADRFDRFVSVMVFVPRDRYDSRIRTLIGAALARIYTGHVSAFYPFFPEGPLVRVHFIIGRREGATPTPDRAAVEQAIEALTETWADKLSEALDASYEPKRARDLGARYRDAFSAGYRELYPPDMAAADIKGIESLSATTPLGVDFSAQADDAPGGVRLKVWSHQRPIPLSERVPVLENMGFRVVDERTYHITPTDHPGVWFHDMMLECNGAGADIAGAKSRLEAAFLVVMGSGAENDGYNALVLGGGLMWREVALVRTISRFLRQISVPFSQDYMWATLRKHASVTALIIKLFDTRFDPRPSIAAAERQSKEAAVVAEIEAALQKVESLDEDRILRHFVNAVTSALRTNFYQIDNAGKPVAQIAIKFASGQIDGLPLPKPLYEIFVYSPRVEGVHLRFGKVARGGIRWSDRPQDFRTEVLGLVKAQQVKNAVIVPVGAKGGFVPKHLPVGGTREAIQAEGTAAYKLFISTLLDLTDNIGSDGVIPPVNTVRHDGDDPYLVVAADKGTATFSDTANAISAEHKFWLDDAFASGGSVGYDHKKMGITARGAWEAVKRHFREMNVDIGVTPFTVAGVGDMSGDVFGNGMLRENTIKLVAAFDHRDIFVDPTPDPEKSLAERQRLFDLPRSSWQDYDKALISKGGGVFPRSAKEIALTPEIKTLLGIAADRAPPQDIMRAILKAPVDLLFFGGIGTYIRAATETDEQAGDRANDPIRITGKDLRTKVIGEGANLGVTQRGRIEAAQQGVRLNTDAIDNSAGVNTSDVEVNIKIALSLPVRDGRLSYEARNEFLRTMTDDVAQLVLRNNYQQTLALSLAERRGLEFLGFQQRLMQILEQRGELNRAVEFLPDELELGERRRRSQALTRPELAVLLAYAKLSLHSELLDSPVPDDPYLALELARYFPAAMAEKFPDALEQHRLRRDIIATQLANSMINRGGPSLVVRIADQTGASSDKITAAFTAVRNSYGMTALNTEIENLDNKIDGGLQLGLFNEVQDLLADRIVWFLRNVDLTQGLAGVIERYRAGIAATEAALDGALSEEANAARAARVRQLAEARVPAELARRIANLPALLAAPDITLVAERTGKSVADVAATYFAASAFLRLDRVIEAARAIKVSDYFDRLALDRSLDTIGDAERRLAAAMVTTGQTGEAAVKAWVAPRQAEVERVRLQIHEIAGTGLTLSKLLVTASVLGDLVRG